MKFYCELNEKFIVAEERFDNEKYIEERISKVPENDRRKLKSVLAYLYLEDGPVNLTNDKYGVIEKYLEEVEIIVAKWLKTRTNGSLRKSYGSRAMLQAKKAKYRCEICGYADVRALHIDHVDGRVEDTDFACLCANCHNIKSREYDWDGSKRY